MANHYSRLTTVKSRVAYIRMMLAGDESWALRGLVSVFEAQTEDEQKCEAVIEPNGVGFTSADGEFLTSLAKQYIRKGSLSDKQMILVFKNMPKYASQLEKRTRTTTTTQAA